MGDTQYRSEGAVRLSFVLVPPRDGCRARPAGRATGLFCSFAGKVSPQFLAVGDVGDRIPALMWVVCDRPPVQITTAP